MAIKWTDISYHTVPAVAVSIGMGFMAATALNSLSMPVAGFFIALATATAIGFAWIWTPRERKQHDGHLGGTQSRLEAFIPFLCGTLAYPPALFVFWKLQI